MNNIGNLAVNFFMASLSAMTGGQMSTLTNAEEPTDSPLPLREGVGGGVTQNPVRSDILNPVRGELVKPRIVPLFRPRGNRHKIVPLELLAAGRADTFHEGARVYLNPSQGPGWEEAIAEETRLAAGEGVESWDDTTQEFFDEVDRNIQMHNENYFKGVGFRKEVEQLTGQQCLDLVLRIESRLGDEKWDVRGVAFRALQNIILSLSDAKWRGLKRVKEGRGASVGALLRIHRQLTDHNQRQVRELLQKAVGKIWLQGRELPATLHFWADIFERWPRLGFPVLEGLVEGVEKGRVSKTPDSEEREGILQFIERTHGFVPAVYAAYKREGEKIFEKIQAYGEKILSEEMGVKDLHAIAEAHSNDGGMEFVLAVIQTVSPTNGASFVKRDQQVGLLKKMLEARDRRRDIPERWQGVVNTFELEQGIWRLKVGEVADPEGKILSLLGQFRAGEGEKVDEAKALDGLEKYLQSERREEDLERVRAVLFAFAGSQDALREKIDRIQDNGYAALDLLDQLFRDKDNLPVLIRDLLGKIPAELLVDKKNEGKRESPSGNMKGLVKRLRGVLDDAKIGESMRVRVVANQLSRYMPESIESNLLGREDIRGTELEGVIRSALEEAPALGKGKVIEAILSKPLDLIQTEKKKFEYEGRETMTVGLRAVKGPAFGMYGSSSGVCTANDIKLWEKPAFKLLAITDEASRQVVGYIQTFESVDEKGRRILTLPGVNPSSEFMATVEAEKLYAGVMAQVIAFAELEGYHGVYIPTGEHIHSNRAGIQRAIRSAGYRTTQIPIVHWNTLPNPYPFQDVYVVWRKE